MLCLVAASALLLCYRLVVNLLTATPRQHSAAHSSPSPGPSAILALSLSFSPISQGKKYVFYEFTITCKWEGEMVDPRTGAVRGQGACCLQPGCY